MFVVLFYLNPDSENYVLDSTRQENGRAGPGGVQQTHGGEGHPDGGAGSGGGKPGL